MKKFAIVCLILGLLCALAVGGYIWSSVPEYVYSEKVVPASSVREVYEEACKLSEEELDGIDEYYVRAVTADLKSRSPFQMEWMTFDVNTAADDLIVEAAGFGPDDVPAFGEGHIRAVILTRRPEEKGALLEYYVLGRIHSISMRNAPEARQ